MIGKVTSRLILNIYFSSDISENQLTVISKATLEGPLRLKNL